eukprot:m.222454 g.222454  ORF g.222454 m.222454 type:complete len:150 (+) comp15934_c1_seq7:1350-1799(+)
MTTKKRAIAYVTRLESFSSAHRLHSPQLSDKENFELYGKCNSVNGHGHNYKIEVTCRGEIDPATGMVINLVDLKKAIHDTVMAKLDHKNIDKDEIYFQSGVVSTAENLAVFAWTELSQLLGPGILYEIKIHETDKNIASFKGEYLDNAC